jgi:hypothetical protein
MKMVSYYAQLVGQQYLHDTLGPIILDFCTSTRSPEIDPLRLKPTDNVEENRQYLELLCDTLFKVILASIEQCPMYVMLYNELVTHLRKGNTVNLSSVSNPSSS